MNLRQMESMATLIERKTAHREVEDIFRLRDLLAGTWKPRLAAIEDPVAAGGQYYVDTRAPFNIGSQATITLATTAKMLWPAAAYTPTFQGEWTPGIEFRLRAYGGITTAATPGNLTVSIAYGTADNTGLLVSSAAQTLVASQTNIPFDVDCYIECRGVGASGSGGSLYAWGRMTVGTAVIAVGAFFIPAVRASAGVNADTTINSGLNIQFARSGSTAETVTIDDIVFQKLN